MRTSPGSFPSLDIFSREGGKISIPGDRKHLQVAFDAGEAPTTLSGPLISGKRVIGNFEGAWTKYYPGEGVLEFSCYTPFNAAVIVQD